MSPTHCIQYHLYFFLSLLGFQNNYKERASSSRIEQKRAENEMCSPASVI